MKKFSNFIKEVIIKLKNRKYPHIHETSSVSFSAKIYNPHNLYMGEQTNISANSVIMNTRAKFIMKKYSGAAFGLTVITGGHISVPGKSHKHITNKIKDEIDFNHEEDIDVIVDEDVWIGARSMLLRGVHLGRGSIVGAGSVVRKSVPPYAIVTGNPAKIVGFRFTPQEMVVHEAALMPENKRLPLETLQKNYEKYYVQRIKEIRNVFKL